MTKWCRNKCTDCTEYVQAFCDIYYTLFSLINAKFRMNPQRVLWILLADLFCESFELCDTENKCISIYNNWILLRSSLHWMKSEESNERADTDHRINFTPKIFSYIYDLRGSFRFSLRTCYLFVSNRHLIWLLISKAIQLHHKWHDCNMNFGHKFMYSCYALMCICSGADNGGSRLEITNLIYSRIK